MKKCNGDCYNCAFALDCYPEDRRTELISKRKMAERAIEHYQRRIAEIDKELERIEANDSKELY